VTLRGSGLLHEVGDWLWRRESLHVHYMKDNVHEHLEVVCPNWPREEDYLSLVGTQTWKYNLKMLSKVFGVLGALEGGLINAG